MLSVYAIQTYRAKKEKILMSFLKRKEAGDMDIRAGGLEGYPSFSLQYLEKGLAEFLDK